MEEPEIATTDEILALRAEVASFAHMQDGQLFMPRDLYDRIKAAGMDVEGCVPCE